MAVRLLVPSIEVGLVTTNRDAMVGFYEGDLGLVRVALHRSAGELEVGLVHPTWCSN